MFEEKFGKIKTNFATLGAQLMNLKINLTLKFGSGTLHAQTISHRGFSPQFNVSLTMVRLYLKW